MTRQEADFDEGLDFDCFLVTGFSEAVTPRMACSAWSKFIGLRDIGFDLSGVTRFFFTTIPLDA